jgi:hypothetical protein
VFEDWAEKLKVEGACVGAGLPKPPTAGVDCCGWKLKTFDVLLGALAWAGVLLPKPPKPPELGAGCDAPKLKVLDDAPAFEAGALPPKVNGFEGALDVAPPVEDVPNLRDLGALILKK